MAWYDAITSGVGSAVDKVDNFIDTKVVPLRLPDKGVAMFDNPLDYFKQDFYPNVVEDSNLFVNKSTANDYTQERGLWSPGLGNAPYVPPVESFSGLGPILIQGGPENIIQGQNNGMTSAQKEALTSMGSYNAFNANQQINPAGTSSPDGMMTMPTNYLYPGEAIGIDGVPYRPSAGQNNNPSSYSYEPNQGGSAAASATPVADVLGTRQFNQRTPSGSVYAPDMSAYNNSSLFNYEGPGGVPEYTYGQGLRTDGADYSIFGSPANAANPYFAGQFATPTGPADAAINMNPVVMPAGVPAIGGGSGSTFTQGPSGVTPRPGGLGVTQQQAAQAMSQAGQDLTYQQTIDSMGIFGPNNPAPSTQFPSPGGATTSAATTPANVGLTGRQIAQMSPQQQTYMTQTLADQNRMQQGQINKNKEIANIASSPDTSIFNPNEQINNAGVSSPDGMMTMPTQPTDMQNYMDDSQFASGVTDRTAQILAQAEANGGVIDDTEVVTNNAGIDAFRESLLRDPSLDREPQNVYGGLDGMFGPYGLHNNEPEGIFAGMPPERNFAKADEVDISTPFVPEGVEGEDFYQDVTGDYFAMEDDLGTQALEPVPDMMSSGPDGRRARGNSSRPLTEAELAPDTGELTSGDMGALDDAMTAIDAKYAGSTTTASQQAELSEIVNSIAMAYGSSSRGSKGDSVSPAQAQATTDAVNAVDNQLMNQLDSRPVYAREQEGTNMAESLFQGVTPVAPINTNDMYEYDGSYENTPGSDAAIDAIVAQSIFNEPVYNTPPVGPPSVISAPPPAYVPPPTIFRPPPAPVAGPPNRPVYNTPPSAPPSYSPPARPSRPTYSFTPSYGGPGGYRF